LDQPVRRLGHDELAEDPRLEARRFVEALVREALDDVDGERRRDVAASLVLRVLVGTRAGPAEEKPASERVLLEGDRVDARALVADAWHAADERPRVTGGRFDQDRLGADLVDEIEAERRDGR